MVNGTAASLIMPAAPITNAILAAVPVIAVAKLESTAVKLFRSIAIKSVAAIEPAVGLEINPAGLVIPAAAFTDAICAAVPVIAVTAVALTAVVAVAPSIAVKSVAITEPAEIVAVKSAGFVIPAAATTAAISAAVPVIVVTFEATTALFDLVSIAVNTVAATDVSVTVNVALAFKAVVNVAN